MTPYQQAFEIKTCTQSINVNFVGANRQFAFLEVYLVYDKNDQHKTIYGSCNVEIVATKIQSLKTENALTTYGLTNEIKYNVDDADNAHWLCTQFVIFSCNGCSMPSLANCANNEVSQDLVRKEKYLTRSDERLYIDLRRSKVYTYNLEKLIRDDSGLTLTVMLIDSATEKMRLGVMAY